MLKFLLDTSIVSAPIASIPNKKVIKRLAQYGLRCAICAPVWHELVYGFQRLPPGKRRKALEAYVLTVVRQSFPILAYDEAAAAWHALERTRLETMGKTPPFIDGQIASIAYSQNLVLVTANTKDFEGFQDIELADWTR